MAEPASRHFGHLDAASGGDGPGDEGGFIADAAGRVFVDLDALDTAQIRRFAAARHGEGQFGRFACVHAAEENGHQQRGGLIIGHGTVGDAADEILDFFFRQRAAVAFVFDDVIHSHGDHLFLAGTCYSHAVKKPPDMTGCFNPKQPDQIPSAEVLRASAPCKRSAI